MHYFLKVKNISEEIEKKDVFSYNDFFVKIKYNDEIRFTTTKWDTQSPMWNEIFLFEGRGKNIEISLMENNKWTSPQEIFTNDLEISDEGYLKTDTCSCIEIEHGYVSLKSAKSQMKIIENLGNIAETIGKSFNSLKTEVSKITF